METKTSAIEIFCCYSRKDQELLENLKAHLAPLRRQRLINIWNDTDISPGTHYEEEITRHLDETVWSIALSADGQTLVSGSSDGTIKIWGKP